MPTTSLKMLPRFVFLVSIASIARYKCGVVETTALDERLVTTDKVPLRALDFDKLGVSQPSYSYTIDKPMPTICETSQSGKSGDHPTKLTPQRRLKIKESWERNQGDLIVLYKDSRELSILGSQLVRDLKAKIDQLDEKDAQPFSTAIELLSLFHKNLVVFKSVKLLELGDIHVSTSKNNLVALLVSNLKKDPRAEPVKLTPDVLDLITQEAWKKFGDSTVDALNQLVIESKSNPQSLLSPNDKLGFQWWRYLFKCVDFLYENQFMSRNTVTIFFHDPDILKNLMDYIRRCVEIDLKGRIYLGAYDLTEHWYWQLQHKSFKAFSNQTKKMINIYYLLKYRYSAEVMPNHRLGLDWFYWQLWFVSQDFLTALQKAPQSPNRPPLMKDCIRKMVKLVATADDHFQNPQDRDIRSPMEFMYDFLEFVPDRLFPGVVTQTLHQYFNYDEIEKRWRLFKISTRMHSLHQNSDRFYEYITEKDSSGWHTSRVYKSMYDSYLNQFISLFDQYKSEFMQFKQQHRNPPNDFDSIIQEVIDYFQSVSTELTRKSNSFTVSFQNSKKQSTSLKRLNGDVNDSRKKKSKISNTVQKGQPSSIDNMV